MKKIKPIKPFKSLDEEANFWDTHDLSKIIDNLKTPLSMLPNLKEDKEAVITIRLQKSLKKAIIRVAQIKGINPATISRMWIIEGLKKEYTHA